MEDLTGRQFGPYQIVEPLGEGGMAAVYKAYQANMDRYVALKVLPRHFANDPEFIGRFSQEAKVIANLQHPHILPVHDFGEADGYTYLTMRFIEGGTLADWLKNNGPLALERIRHIISQVGGALDYAHAQGVVHRDIKPSNILVDRWDNCLLTDFGLAKIASSAAHLTQTGGILGTPAYMSPEQGLGQKIDGRSDIYSLGVVLYQMAIGRLPYQAETPMAVVIKHIHDPLPPPHRYNPDLPDGVERVILKALAKNPEDRFETAGEMVKMLQSATERPTVAQAAAPPLPDPATVVAPPLSSPPEIPPTAISPPLSEPVMETPLARTGRKKRPYLAIGLGLAGIILIVILGLVIASSIDESGGSGEFQDVTSIEEIQSILDDAYASGDTERVLAALDRAIEMEPDRADLHCEYGYAWRDIDDNQTAVESFEECRRLAQEQQEPELQSEALGQVAFTQAALVLMETDDPGAALGIFDEAMMEPNAPPWLICERGEYNLWYDNEAAVADFKACKTENSGDDYWPWRSESVINMILGYDALDHEDYYQAIEHFSVWAEMVPDAPWALCALGDAHAGAGEFQPALEFYTQCGEMAGDDEDLQNSAQSGGFYAKGRLALFDGDLDMAVENYSQALDYSPDDGSLFCERGVLHRELGDIDAARDDYETCLEISGDDPDTRQWAEELLRDLESADQ